MSSLPSSLITRTGNSIKDSLRYLLLRPKMKGQLHFTDFISPIVRPNSFKYWDIHKTPAGLIGAPMSNIINFLPRSVQVQLICSSSPITISYLQRLIAVVGVTSVVTLLTLLTSTFSVNNFLISLQSTLNWLQSLHLQVMHLGKLCEVTGLYRVCDRSQFPYPNLGPSYLECLLKPPL